VKSENVTFQLRWVSRLGPRSSRLIVGKQCTEQVILWMCLMV